MLNQYLIAPLIDNNAGTDERRRFTVSLCVPSKGASLQAQDNSDLLLIDDTALLMSALKDSVTFT